MVTPKYDFENPTPVKGEQEGLRQLMSELKSGNPRELTHYLSQAENLLFYLAQAIQRPELTTPEKDVKAYELLQQACIGDILRSSDPEEQLLNYRRLMMAIDATDEVPIDRAVLAIKDLGRSLKS